jgi:hypothetical protein
MAINIEFNNQPIREFVEILNQANEGLNDLKNTGEDIPDGFSNLSEKVQKYSDKIKDATEKGKTFKTNYGEAIGKVGEGFASLNPILGGIDKALGTTFGKNLSAITGFGEAIAGTARTAQIFGSALSGLGPVVKGASGAFQAFGNVLKANPIFLIASVIAAVVVGFGALLSSLGLLQPILDAIQAILQPIIDGFKALTSSFGLNGDAAADSAKQVAEYESALSSLNFTATITNAVLQEELILAEARGDSDKQLLAIRQRIAAQTVKDAEIEIGLNATRVDQLKYALQTEKLSAKEKIDLEKEIATVQQKNATLNAKIIIEQAKIRAEATKLDRAEKAKLEEDGKKAQEQAKVNQEKENERIRKNLELLKESERAKIIVTEDASTARFEAELRAIDAIEQFQIQYAKNLGITENGITILKAENIEKRKKLEDDYYAYVSKAAIINLEEKKFQSTLETDIQKLGLKAVADVEQADFRTRFQRRQDEIKQLATDAEKAAAFAKQSADIIIGFGNLIFDNKRRNLKKGSEEEIKVAKKQFLFNKALQLSLAVMDGYKAITASLAQSPIAIGPVPNPAGIASLAFAAATSALNIARIASTRFEGGGAAPAAPNASSAAGAISTPGAAATPSLNLFGQANTGNVSAATSNTTVMGPGGQLRVIATVSETEITAVQNRNLNYALNSEL